MQLLAAEAATRIANAPLCSFPLAHGAAAIFASAEDIAPRLWEETFGRQAKDFSYYALLERTMARGFGYRYLVLSLPNEQPFALQPLILVDQDLAISLGGKSALVVRTLRRIFPRFLRARMLMAGCLVGDAHFGVRKNFSRQTSAALLAEALLGYAAAEGIFLLTMKDFPSANRNELQPLIDAGFTRLDGFPSLQMPLNFESFEHYMQTRLSKMTRKNLRRKFRASAAASPALTLEVLTDCREVIDEIYPLYLAVARRSDVQFETFSREYFLQASLTMPNRCRFFIWRQQGRAVAFSYCTVCGETIYDHDLGLNYAVAHQLHLYHVTFRDLIEWSLRHGYRVYRTSPFNYETKLRLRLAFSPNDLFVRHRIPFWNLLIRKFAHHFAPARTDAVLREHFPATG